MCGWGVSGGEGLLSAVIDVSSNARGGSPKEVNQVLGFGLHEYRGCSQHLSDT